MPHRPSRFRDGLATTTRKVSCGALGRLGVQLWQNRFSRQPRSWWTIWKSYAAPNFKEKIKCCTLHSKFAVVKECRHILIPNIARRNNFKNSMKTCSNEIFNRQNHPKFHATMNTLACQDRIFFCLGRKSFTTFFWEETKFVMDHWICQLS